MNYKIAQFILTPAKNVQTSLEVYLAQPDADKEALAGKLFALIEIQSSKAENLKIVNFLINTLNHNYYQNEKLILRERLNTIKIEHIFESALAKTNKKLAEFLASEKIRLNSQILNITVGVVSSEGLHFANLGKNKALLIYKGAALDNGKYKLADITGQTGSGEAKKAGLSATKLFQNVVSGALPRGGYFIFTNETLPEYLSSSRLIEIITALPPASAAEQIKNTVCKINAYVPFLGIIIKNTAGLEMEEIKTAKEPPAGSRRSIDGLIGTEERTEKLLSPPGLISLKKWGGLFKDGGRPGQTAFVLKDKIFAKKKTGWQAAKKIFGFLKKSAWLLAALSAVIFKIITDKKAFTDFFGKLVSGIKSFLAALMAGRQKSFFWFRNLTKINKILFSCLCLSLLIFALSLAGQSLKKQKLERQAAYDGLTASAEQRLNQIDASLLYDNETGAKKLLAEVKELIDRLPQKNEPQKDLYNALAAKYQVQIEKIRRVIRLNPLPLADFINLNPKASPANIIFLSGKIYAADAGQKTIYVCDPASKLTTSISLAGQNLSRLDFPSLDKNNNIYYFNLNGLMILDSKTEKLSSLDIDFPGSTKIIGLKQYNNRFYLADAASGQIYRFTKSGGKLTNPIAWLNSSQDLSNLSDMTIDGDIYLLETNGEILKYAKGKKLDFTLAELEPAFSQAAKIMAEAEQNNIYIFEPDASRLAVFEKSGKFLNQYEFSGLSGLKDFQIDEKNKKIYLLNNSSVYSADLAK